MRYILIDPVAQTVTAENYDGQIDWRVICNKLGCGTMASAGRLANGDILWVDDEGLLKDGQSYFSFQAVNGQPLAGRGMITGPETLLRPGAMPGEEDINDVQSSPGDVQLGVIFLGEMKVTETTMTTHETPGMTVFHIGHKIEPA